MNALMYIIIAIWFMIPAYIANASPVIFYKIKFLDLPVDFGKKIKGRRLFGDHKTWRGLFFGIITGTAVSVVQFYLTYISYIKQITIIPIDLSTFIFFGLLMSTGALLGDLIESFFKRLVGIEPGKDMVGFDQLDFVIGAWALTFWFWPKDIYFYITVLIISPILHITSNVTKPFFMKKK